MAIEWELYRLIRQLYLTEKLSQRAIAKTLKVSRRTVRKYCQGATIPDMRKKPGRESQLRQSVEEDITRLLEGNRDLPKKSRLSGTDIWKYLVNEKGVQISVTTIRCYIRDILEKRPEVFIPLVHEPGDAIEFDWGEMKAYIRGVLVKVSVFCAILPYCGNICAFAYPDEKELSFLDGHIKAFEAFNGVSRRCIYDNLRTAVKKYSGKRAQKQADFDRIEAHYGFEAVFCNARRGWEKSHIENAVATVRTIAFTPMPRVETYEELQAHLTNRCLDYAKTHKIRGRKNSIWEDYLVEKDTLLPLPELPFDCGFTITAKVYRDLTFIYEGVHYSIPYEYAGKEVSLRLSPFHIKVYHKGKEIWEHRRMGKNGVSQYVFEHYLPVLEQKPRAIEQAVPITYGVMPEPCEVFLRRCKEKDARKQLVDALLLGRDFGKEELLLAIEQANNTLSPSLPLIRLFLETPSTRELEEHVTIEQNNLAEYDKLIPGGGYDGEGDR